MPDCNAFAIVVSGRLPQTEFVQVDVNKFLITIPNADTINHIVVFMTGTTPFPDGLAGAVYFSWPDSNAPPSWQYLGFLSNDKPSAIFKITQLKKEDDMSMSSFGFQQTIVSHVAQVGISVDSALTINSLAPVITVTCNGQEKNMMANLATKIAENMFNFCASFAQTPSMISPMINDQLVPMSTIKQWYERFIKRVEQDPSYVLPVNNN